MTVAEMLDRFTAEQVEAIERRDGELFLDAAAGSGKTSVLVERFARAVVEDGIDPAAILTITFTEKAAAEMRERIRGRLRELGAIEEARATEGAFISTIHGFCARVLRAQALAAGIDPAFTVLDELESGQLSDAAFEAALVEVGDNAPGALELIAGYGAWELRAAIRSVYGELRSRGQRSPRLPPLPDAPGLEAERRRVERAAAEVSAELRAVDDPSQRVLQALDRLQRVPEVLASAEPWPGEIDALRLPGGNGAALSTSACGGYGEALTALRAACAYRWAQRAYPLLDRLLVQFGARYEQAKADRSGLDFEDLELRCRDLLRANAELRERYRTRFARVMVDELQDTNAVQLEVIEMVSAENLFTVGDAQQSIYGFRHADVELFRERGERLGRDDARATLRTNFRSRAEILEVVNRVFAREFDERFIALEPGRDDPPAHDPRVELLVADRGAEWAPEGLASPWRLAEARALARRVGELVADGASPRDVVVLMRATTDMRVYERALEELGVPTYVIGGRGYWSHPQVVDLIAYLRLLANPRDEESLFMVLASPLVGASTDALVLLAAAGRHSGRDPWWVLREPEDRLDELSAEDRQRLEPFAAWLALERAPSPRRSVEHLIERVLEQTGYDLAVLAMPGGQRRLANVRKLMRLGRDHAAAHGPDLRGFLDLVELRSAAWLADPDESEAPVESEALDAVRLMTIHRAKGLEFEIVCVADLGRAPRSSAELIRIGTDGRLGLRLARPGTGRREPALQWEELGEQQRARSAAEERRLFYVAMTRARERLILSGATKVEAWGAPARGGAPPVAWLGPALVRDVSPGEGVSEGVRFCVVQPSQGEVDDLRVRMRPSDHPDQGEAAVATPPLPSPTRSPSPVPFLSYTSLAAYRRCGYRFYVERVLGVPGTEDQGGRGPAIAGALTPAERGTAVHALLERIDFRRPVAPSEAAILAACARPPSPAEAEEIVGLVTRFAGTALGARLGRATRVGREERFAFLLGDTLITGMLDAIASEPSNRTLIVDYKSDRLEGRDPAAIVSGEYAAQQLIYAIAALRAGAEEVEVVHVFLESPDRVVSATFTSGESERLEQELRALAAGLLERGSFEVTETPHRGVCRGCPAEGGLCSWPLEMTRRETADRLF